MIAVLTPSHVGSFSGRTNPGEIILPSSKTLRTEYVRAASLSCWRALCGYSTLPGSRVAMKALGTVAKILKGHDPRTVARLLGEADLSKVPTQLSIDKQKEIKALNDRLLKGDIKESSHKERLGAIAKKYEDAGAYWATFDLAVFLDHVVKIRANMSTLACVVKASATGAKMQMTIDEALMGIFGHNLNLKDVQGSIDAGLALQ